MVDQAVQRTNEDATLCKRSAVYYGYWQDEYLAAFAPNPPGLPGSRTSGEMRKAPEIHLGYFTRVTGLWTLLDRIVSLLVQADKGLQVVNLGAGFDTLYWRLKDHLEQNYREERSAAADENQREILRNFVDVDLPEVAASKCALVKRSKTLLERVADGEGEVRLSSTDLHGTNYHIVACDFTQTAALEQKLADCNLDYSVPTVFVSECVFVYLEPTKVSGFLKWIKSKFNKTGVALLNHEQLNMNDRFGKVMLDNLSQRGCGLPGVSACKDKQAQKERLTVTCGWDGAICWTMNEVYSMLPKDEVARVERLEFLDERELVNQLFEHYCITFGWINGGSDVNFDDLEIW